jgi:hypothetical protein
MGRPNKFDGMMHELIAGLGWDCRCFKNGKPLFVNDFIPETGTVSADQIREMRHHGGGTRPSAKKIQTPDTRTKGSFREEYGRRRC